jgi:hypothetical protein
MVDVTRRFFLFGSAAAVAVATIGRPFAIPAPSPVVATPYRRRLITGIELIPQPPVPGRDVPVTFRFFRGSNGDLMKEWTINARGMLSWRSVEDLDAIVMLKDEVLIVEMIGGTGLGEAQLYCRDKVDAGPEISRLEIHTWPQNGPAQVYELEAGRVLGERVRV